MPNPLSHHPSMLTVIRPSVMPRLWWLNPWAAAKYLHSAATAMKDYTDRVDRVLDIQKSIIEDQSAEIAGLRHKLAAAESSRQHWITKHDRAYAVAMHNERVIMRLEDSITAGNAITPDARPYHAASERLQDNPQFRDETIHE